MTEKRCSVEGCEQHMRHSVKGMCSMHYQRLYLKGDIGGLKPLARVYTGVKRPRKDIKLWYDHNISLEDYTRMLESQGRACAICRTTQVPIKGWFYVDHDHRCCPTKARSCGKCIRGLLCNNCNTGLGYFADNPEAMRRAAEYVTKDRTNVRN